jgi:hypothetical protein
MAEMNEGSTMLFAFGVGVLLFTWNFEESFIVSVARASGFWSTFFTLGPYVFERVLKWIIKNIKGIFYCWLWGFGVATGFIIIESSWIFGNNLAIFYYGFMIAFAVALACHDYKKWRNNDGNAI